MQDAEENVRGSEVVKTEHISVIENALFFVYINCELICKHALQASPAWVSVEGDFDMGRRLFTGSGREDGECRAI